MPTLGFNDGSASVFYLVLFYFPIFARSFSAPSFLCKPQRHSPSQLKLGFRIREWQEADMSQIKLLLEDSAPSDFDPEGPLDVDCGSVAAIQESYDGGCFLVAMDNDSNVLGTAALIVGTQIACLKSGASMSTPAITGAVRRVCTVDEGGNVSILKSLLEEIEARAKHLGADELIILAYPSTQRPHPDLIERLGYQKLPTPLPRVDARQYAKVLDTAKPSSKDNNNMMKMNKSVSNSDIGDAALATLFAIILLVSFGFIVNYMGFDILP